MQRLTVPIALAIMSICLLAWSRPATAGRASYAVPNQLIISGGEAELFEATKTISDSLQPLHVTELGWFNRLLPEMHPFGGLADVSSWLMLINNPALTVDSALAQIDASGAEVVASPNWVVAAAAPWYIEGAPSVPPAVILADTPLTGQAAFTQINYSGPSAFDGDRVRVGIFDTSPYAAGLTGTFSTAVKSLPIVVYHDAPLPVPSPVMTTTDYGEHGSAVASLSGALAPAADYQLYRVLNRGGVGSLYGLNSALSAYIDGADLAQQAGNIDAAAINLSLVVHAPLGDVVPTLDVVLFGGYQFGIEMVAAAGNESDHTLALPPKLPAAYDYVLAVAAAELSDGRACFSHSGDIGAGGGDAISGGVCDPPTMTERIRGWAVGDGQQVEWAGTSFATPLATGATALLLDQHNGRPQLERATDIIERTARTVVDPALGEGILDLGAALAAPPLAVRLKAASAAQQLTALPALAVLLLMLATTLHLKVRRH